MGAANNSDAERTSVFEEVLAEYMLRIDRGDAVDREQFIAEHPEHTGALRAYFADADGLKSVTGPMPQDLAEHFPELDILEPIGQGGMGLVYKARQRKLDRPVALKIVRPELAGDREFAGRFESEAYLLAKLNHPNIVTIHDYGKAGGYLFLIMEYVEGVSVRKLIGQLTPAETLAIIPQICDALQYAHGEKIIHRDIKPENILVDKTGRVKLADMGLARLVTPAPGEHRLTRFGEVLGTRNYMSPEQIESALDVDHRADIYSLGVVFYEMLTGELPLGRFPPPSQKAKVDSRLDKVVERALEKEREKRYQHVSEVKTDIESVPVLTKEVPMNSLELPRPQQKQQQLVLWIAVVAVVCCMVLAVGVIAVQSFNNGNGNQHAFLPNEKDKGNGKKPISKLPGPAVWDFTQFKKAPVKVVNMTYDPKARKIHWLYEFTKDLGVISIVSWSAGPPFHYECFDRDGVRLKTVYAKYGIGDFDYKKGQRFRLTLDLPAQEIWSKTTNVKAMYRE